jgi:phosphatidylserine decarboxylase
MNSKTLHQYIDRASARVMTETLTADPVIRAVYAGIRDNASLVFNLLVSKRMSWVLGALSYDFPFRRPLRDPLAFLKASGIDLREAADDPASFTTYRKIFERRIRYRELRPMPEDPSAVVSPADAKVLLGSFDRGGDLFIKGKFFEYPELLGTDKSLWCSLFRDGDFAVFRLTPEKYHYNHTPVTGNVADIYEISGNYHSCNPGAVVREVTPYSKNRRVVTILDTDVPGGTGVGRVAMVEVAAMMIGDVVQCYSRKRYADPAALAPGMFLEKGCPKSLFRPGSSTTILIFEKNRVRFAPDLVANVNRTDVASRFSEGFGRPLVETDLAVRSMVGYGIASRNCGGKMHL